VLLTWSIIRKSGHRFSEKIMLNQFYCVVLAQRPVGRRASLRRRAYTASGVGENRLVGVSPMRAILVASAANGPLGRQIQDDNLPKGDLLFG
jgi:hypothetical protein